MAPTPCTWTATAICWATYEDEGAIGNYGVITGVNSTGHANGFLAVEVKMILADGTTGKYDVNLLASANKYGLRQDGTNAQKESDMYDLLTDDTAPRDGNVGANSMVGQLVSYAISDNTITFIDPTSPPAATSAPSTTTPPTMS